MNNKLTPGKVIARSTFIALVLVTIFSIPEAFLALPTAAQLSIGAVVCALAALVFCAVIAHESDGQRR